MAETDHIMFLELDRIEVGQRREVDPATVKKLASSIREIGLQHPITVRKWGDKYTLIAGRHRLEAVRSNGEMCIESHIVSWNRDKARMWEISENLHRAELTELERKDQIGEWIELRKKQQEDDRRISRQVAEKLPVGRPEGGTSLAARELGIDEREARRALEIRGISPEAKEAAREAGIADNQSALLQVAKAEPEQQVAKVHELAAKPRATSDWRERLTKLVAEATLEELYWGYELFVDVIEACDKAEAV